MCLDRAENILICGLSNGIVTALSIPDLRNVRSFDLSKHGRVRSLCNTTGIHNLFENTEDFELILYPLDGQYLIVGSDDGYLHACFDPEGYFARLNAALQRQKGTDATSSTPSTGP